MGLFKLFIILCIWVFLPADVFVYMCMQCPGGQKRVLNPLLGTIVSQGLNSGPFQKQYVLLTCEPSLRLLIYLSS